MFSFMTKFLRKHIDKLAHYGLANMIVKLFQLIGLIINIKFNISQGLFIMLSFIFVIGGSIYWEKYYQKIGRYFNIYDVLFALIGWVSGVIGVYE